MSILIASPVASPASSPTAGDDGGLSLIAGLWCAKNRILIAMASPACSAMTTTSRIRDVFASVAETTG